MRYAQAAKTAKARKHQKTRPDFHDNSLKAQINNSIQQRRWCGLDLAFLADSFEHPSRKPDSILSRRVYGLDLSVSKVKSWKIKIREIFLEFILYKKQQTYPQTNRLKKLGFLRIIFNEKIIYPQKQALDIAITLLHYLKKIVSEKTT